MTIEVDPTSDPLEPLRQDTCAACGVPVVTNRIVPHCVKCGEAFLSELLGNLGMKIVRLDYTNVPPKPKDTP